MQEAAKSNQAQLEKDRAELDTQQALLDNQKASVQAQMQMILNETVSVEQLKKKPLK